MGDPPPFATFNADNGQGSYRRFIDRLCEEVASTGRYSHNRPVLPPRGGPPGWIDIILQTEQRRLRIRLRREDLYVVGFRNEDGGQWFEFADDGSPHQISGSTSLGFGGNYDCLETGGRREGIELGRRPLQDAIHHLVNVRDQVRSREEKKARMHSLIVIIQMISESLRFFYIRDILTREWLNNIKPSHTMLACENSWGAISGALLHDDQDAHSGGSWRIRHSSLREFESAINATTLIAVLLYHTVPGTPRPKREVAAVRWDDYPRGRILVEVFWLRINSIDSEDPGQLYGTISAVDGQGSQYVFNQNQSNASPVKPGNYALFSGPLECISAEDSVTLNVDLWDYDVFSPDDRIAQGKASWSSYNQNEYDTPVTWEISGDNGSATLSYIVLSNAAQAMVEVVLINGDGEDPANVYGSITADNGHGNSELFRKKSDEYVDVSPGADIPLSRSAIAVPIEGPLFIKAELYDHDSFSADDEIAHGTIRFTPSILKSERQYIPGKYGKIEARVSWS